MWSCMPPDNDVIGPRKNDDVIISVSLIACLGGTGTNPVGTVQLELCPLNVKMTSPKSVFFTAYFYKIFLCSNFLNPTMKILNFFCFYPRLLTPEVCLGHEGYGWIALD